MIIDPSLLGRPGGSRRLRALGATVLLGTSTAGVTASLAATAAAAAAATTLADSSSAFAGPLTAATKTGATARARSSAVEQGPFARVRAALAAATDPVPAIEELAAAHPDVVRIIRPLADDPGFIVVELGTGSDEQRRSRPALLVVAGLDGRHTVGTAAAVRLAESLLDDPAPLEGATVCIVPRVVEPGLLSGRFPVPDDADHDGRQDEDGPNDLDGDGVIRMMRLAEPSPLSGLEATHVIDADDPRVMRPARGEEQATHVLLPEGRDDDGDGRIAEDAVGGTAANADWPAHWPEFADGVSDWPLSVPRTRALADWVLGAEHIAAVLVFGPGDSLASVPTTRGAGPTNRVPEGLLEADEADHERVSRRFKDQTGITGGDRGPRAPGSFDAWAYAHLGLWSFATPLWDRPDRMGDLARVPGAGGADEAAGTAGAGAGAEDGAGAGAGGGSDAAGGGGSGDASSPSRGERRGRGGPATDDAAWLAWIDAERDGAGFLDWTTFDHPELGPVEIGGIDPALAHDPPADLLPAIAAKGAAFARDLIDMFPRLEITAAEIRPVSGDIHTVAVTVRNVGALPTRPAIATRARRLTPTLVRLSVDDDAILAGPPLTRIDRIDAGASVVLRWQIRVQRPDEVAVIVTDPMHGRLSTTLSLGEED